MCISFIFIAFHFFCWSKVKNRNRDSLKKKVKGGGTYKVEKGTFEKRSKEFFKGEKKGDFKRVTFFRS